jgi:DNA-binding protein HU-beta
MKKADLIKAVAKASGVDQKNVDAVLSAFSLVITEVLSMSPDEDITIQDIGKLSVKARAARTGRNPATGETIQIAAGKAVTFKAAKALKDAL